MPRNSSEICKALLYQYADTQGFFDYQNTIGAVTYAIKYYPDGTEVFFEGSRNIPDWYSNFKALMIIVPNFGCVEQGFYEHMPEAIDDIIPRIQPNKPVGMGGHSRGGSHANVGSRLLIDKGFDKSTIKRTLFAPARCFDVAGVAALNGCPGVAYRNYHDELEQDFVADVPVHFMLEPYAITDTWTDIDEAAEPNDPWLLLKRHHLFLYDRSFNV